MKVIIMLILLQMSPLYIKDTVYIAKDSVSFAGLDTNCCKDSLFYQWLLFLIEVANRKIPIDCGHSLIMPTLTQWK
jgi:hypothetical protein